MTATTTPLNIPKISLPQYLFRNLDTVREKPALIDAPSGKTISFNTLHDTSRSLASGLLRHGVVSGDVVGVVCGNSIEFVQFYLACGWIGAVLSPMSPLLSAGEIRTQLLTAQAHALMADEASLEKSLEAAAGTPLASVISTTAHKRVVPLQSLFSADPLPAISLDPGKDLAALPFSSGTTGLPKGVMLTHTNLVANIVQLSAVEPVSSSDTFIGLLPFSHIYGLTVVLNLGLANGAAVVLLPAFKPEALLQALQAYRVTRAHFVPPIIRFLAQSDLPDSYDLSSLQVIVSGAAPLDESTAKDCARRLKCVVKQGYGLTESSPVTHISPDPPGTIKVTSVGPALPATEVRIIDPEHGNELPHGEAGEVLVRGPQVMAGYLNDARASRDAITADGWLHTGDIGLVDEDGYLFLVDRIKEMIKVKGYQVAPAEIEAVLMSHPQIIDAAVIPSPDPEFGEVPKAYVVSTASLTAEQVISHVAERLGPIKHVGKVSFIENIPRSGSGKILRRVLIDQDRAC